VVFSEVHIKHRPGPTPIGVQPSDRSYADCLRLLSPRESRGYIFLLGYSPP
jgi:hypothetical protein